VVVLPLDDTETLSATREAMVTAGGRAHPATPNTTEISAVVRSGRTRPPEPPGDGGASDCIPRLKERQRDAPKRTSLERAMGRTKD
jgi:hypothetical protein